MLHTVGQQNTVTISNGSTANPVSTAVRSGSVFGGGTYLPEDAQVSGSEKDEETLNVGWCGIPACRSTYTI